MSSIFFPPCLCQIINLESCKKYYCKSMIWYWKAFAAVPLKALLAFATSKRAVTADAFKNSFLHFLCCVLGICSIPYDCVIRFDYSLIFLVVGRADSECVEKLFFSPHSLILHLLTLLLLFIFWSERGREIIKMKC